jgi:signal transduction histidine kinase
VAPGSRNRAPWADPFFTTKPAGAGTGLGLASVYSILRKAGGHLHIASEPGAGTTIETYWQAQDKTATCA